MTDTTVADIGPAVDWPSGVIAGSVVRDLVDRNEREIDELLRELDAVVAEADQAERLVAGHPAATLLGLEFGVFAPEDAEDRLAGTALTPTAPATSGPATETRRPTGATRPRTTVVVRSSPATTPTTATTAPTTSSGVVLADTAGSAGWVQRFQTHWMAKVGVAVTLVAVLLLKFG